MFASRGGVSARHSRAKRADQGLLSYLLLALGGRPDWVDEFIHALLRAARMYSPQINAHTFRELCFGANSTLRDIARIRRRRVAGGSARIAFALAQGRHRSIRVTSGPGTWTVGDPCAATAARHEPDPLDPIAVGSPVNSPVRHAPNVGSFRVRVTPRHGAPDPRARRDAPGRWTTPTASTGTVDEIICTAYSLNDHSGTGHPPLRRGVRY